MRVRGIAIALALLAGPAAAQPAAVAKPACAAMDRALPAEFSAWTRPSPLAAADRPETAAKATLSVGKAAAVQLGPQTRFALPPEKPSAPASEGGLFKLDIDEAGAYVVAVGSAAWVDLVKDGKPLTSTGHGHGPDCSTIRKWVEFRLQPGGYLLQLSGNPGPQAAVLVAKRP